MRSPVLWDMESPHSPTTGRFFSRFLKWPSRHKEPIKGGPNPDPPYLLGEMAQDGATHRSGVPVDVTLVVRPIKQLELSTSRACRRSCRGKPYYNARYRLSNVAKTGYDYTRGELRFLGWVRAHWRPVKARWNQRFPIGHDSFRTDLSIFPIPVRLISRTSSGLEIWRNQEEVVRYTLLIHLDERAMEGKPPEEMAPVLDAWYQYTSALQSSKTWLAGEALQPTSAATTVRVQGDRTIVTDGPYAETKEQLGGFYMIEAENLDQAIEWAAKMPHMAGGGAVEVRPVMEFPDH